MKGKQLEEVGIGGGANLKALSKLISSSISTIRPICCKVDRFFLSKATKINYFQVSFVIDFVILFLISVHLVMMKEL